MTIRTKILLALAALAVVAVVVSSVGGGGSELRFVAPAAERGAADAGPSGPALGDTATFAGPLLDEDGDEAGRIDGVCTLTSRPEAAGERRQGCAVTLTVGVENGETELQLAAVGRVEADDVLYSVVGGSGRFGAARGHATFDLRDRERATIEVRLKE